LRIASRVLRREWRAAASAVACIAVGIGASTAMFSVADALLLRPLPFPNADQLYVVSTSKIDRSEATGTSYEDFLDWRQRQHSFAELAAYGATPFPIVVDRPVRATAVLTTANVFRVVGVTPIRGRAFVDGEDQLNADPVAVVKRGFAERRYHWPGRGSWRRPLAGAA
jgi:putative ABC transport system permease protein